MKFRLSVMQKKGFVAFKDTEIESSNNIIQTKQTISTKHQVTVHKKIKNTMWTFCLIKGLETLPWSCRKSPIYFFLLNFRLHFFSVLFNFMLQFVFITRQQRVSGHPKQYHAEFKYLCLSNDHEVSASINIKMFLTLPPSKKAWQASRHPHSM